MEPIKYHEIYSALQRPSPSTDVHASNDNGELTNVHYPQQERSVRLCNLIHNKPNELFDFVQPEEVVCHRSNNDHHEIERLVKDGYVFTPQGAMIRPKLFFTCLFDAAELVGLPSVTPSSLPHWILRLRLLAAIDEHPFYKIERTSPEPDEEHREGQPFLKTEGIPYIPSVKQLAHAFGVEFFGIIHKTHTFFINEIVTHINRDVATELQSELCGTLRSEYALDFNTKADKPG